MPKSCSDVNLKSVIFSPPPANNDWKLVMFPVAPRQPTAITAGKTSAMDKIKSSDELKLDDDEASSTTTHSDDNCDSDENATDINDSASRPRYQRHSKIISNGSGGNGTRYLLLNALHFIALLAQALTQGPKFAEPIPNVTVAVGRETSLPCVVEHLGTHKVAWIHIDRQMILTIHRHVITRIPRFSVSYDNHKTWQLHVNSVHEEDRGYYMCQVNTEPMISQVGYLQVVVPPNIIDEESSESHVAVRENQNVSLSCAAEGFPTPKIVWKREDGQPFTVDKRKKVNVSEGERLHLVRISRMEMGAYLCIASNGVPPSVSKRITLDVEFSPMIWVPNQLVGAPVGTDVTLECHSEAFPRSISYWVYDGVMLLSTKKYRTETSDMSYRTHMRLTVRNLRERDYGKYRCIAKNSLGETEGSIRLYEIPLPSLPPKTNEVRSGGGGRKDETASRNASRTTSSAVAPSSSSAGEEMSKRDDKSNRDGILFVDPDEEEDEAGNNRNEKGSGGNRHKSKSSGTSFPCTTGALLLTTTTLHFVTKFLGWH